jgi:hypothetical protein
MEQADPRTHRTPVRLAFADYVNRFKAGDRAPSSPVGAKMLTRADLALDVPDDPVPGRYWSHDRRDL